MAPNKISCDKILIILRQHLLQRDFYGRREKSNVHRFDRRG